MSETQDLFKTWHFYDEEPNKHDFSVEDDSNMWTSNREFQWCGDEEVIKKTLWAEGVVKSGSVSETYLGSTIRTYFLSSLHVICIFVTNIFNWAQPD